MIVTTRVVVLRVAFEAARLVIGGMLKCKTSTGRRKIEIKPVENKAARQACFSKRRQGLFKKASELSILCGAMVGAVVFSATGRSFSFGYPSIRAVTDRFLKSGTGGESHDSSGVTEAVDRTNSEYEELEQSVEAGRKRKERLKEEIEQEMGGRLIQFLTANVYTLGFDALQEFRKDLAVQGCSQGNNQSGGARRRAARRATATYGHGFLLREPAVWWAVYHSQFCHCSGFKR